MDVTWFYWLDAIDYDHAIIGSRADEILERGLYEDPFDFGGLYYIQYLKVHPSFRGNKLGIQLIQYTFKLLIRNDNGMIFVIAQEPITERSKEQSKFKKSNGLIKYYEGTSFTRSFNSTIKDIKDFVMEVEIKKLRNWS